MAHAPQHTEERGRGSRLYHGVLLNTAGTAINITFLFLETVVAVRLLDRNDYGVYVLLVAVTNFFVMAADFGGKTTLTQMIAVSDRIRQAALAGTAFLFRVGVIVLLAVVIWLGQGLLLWVFPALDVAQFSAFIPAMVAVLSLDELFLGMLQGFGAFRQIAIAQILRSILRLGLTLFFLMVMDLGIAALVYSWVISFAVSAGYQWLALPLPRRPIYRAPLLREIMRFGLVVHLNRLLWFISNRVHVLLLGWLVGAGGVAYYAVAERIPNTLQRFFSSYVTVFFPTMATLLARGKRNEANAMLNDSLRLVSFASASLALAGALYGREVMAVLFSEKYLSSGPVFSILMLALNMQLSVHLMGFALMSAGYPQRSLAVTSTQTTATVLGDLLLIPRLGYLGPACAVALGSYSVNPLFVWVLQRSGITPQALPYVKQTGLLLACTALFWWLQPQSLAARFGIWVLFVLLNLAWTTVTRHDLALVLPGHLRAERKAQRLGDR